MCSPWCPPCWARKHATQYLRVGNRKLMVTLLGMVGKMGERWSSIKMGRLCLLLNKKLQGNMLTQTMCSVHSALRARWMSHIRRRWNVVPRLAQCQKRSRALQFVKAVHFIKMFISLFVLIRSCLGCRHGCIRR